MVRGIHKVTFFLHRSSLSPPSSSLQACISHVPLGEPVAGIGFEWKQLQQQKKQATVFQALASSP